MQSAVRKEILVQVEMVIEPDENGFHVYCPALKGLHVGGDTEEEAIKNAEDKGYYREDVATIHCTVLGRTCSKPPFKMRKEHHLAIKQAFNSLLNGNSR